MTKAIDVLRAKRDWIDADELFKKCGIRDGVSTEVVEEIYAELRALDQARKLAVRRVENGDQLKLLRD